MRIIFSFVVFIILRIFRLGTFYASQISEKNKELQIGIFADNLGSFLLILHKKAYVMTLHPNRLDETVQMKGHNIWFR